MKLNYSSPSLDILKYAGLLFLFFVPFLLYVHAAFFIDEGDNMIGGMVVASGGEIYKDFYSQHTPLMYYLLALFKVLGANSLFLFRFYFYAFSSLCFTLIYARYKADFGKVPLILFPLIYVGSFISNPTVSYSIVSEHIQSIAYVILVLEFLKFVQRKILTINAMVAVSLAAFCSIGVAFVSVYVVAVIAISILIIKIQEIYKKENSVSEVARRMIIEFRIPVLVGLAPFVIFFLWYAVRDNLHNLYYQAYVFNREIYSKYTGGFGTNALTPLVHTVNYFVSTIIYYIRNFFESPVDSFRHLVNPGANIYFSILIFNKNKAAGVAIVLITLASMIRGTAGFHSMPYWALSALMLALIFNKGLMLIQRMEINKKSVVLFSILSAITFYSILEPNIVLMRTKLENKKTVASVSPALTKEFFIEKLLGKGEGFFETSISPLAYINTNRLPSIKTYGIVPWFTDIYEQDIINQLKKTKTKLIFHNPKNSVWGYVLQNYAPKLNNYILINYTRLRGDFTLNSPDNVYIRNQDYDRSLRILVASNPEIFRFMPGLKLRLPQKPEPVGEILGDRTAIQSFKSEYNGLSKVYIMLATYARPNDATLRLSLLAGDGTVIVFKNVDTSKLQDNSFYGFQFPPILDSSGKRYKIRLSSPDGKPGNAVTAWMSKSDIYPEGALSVGGVTMPGDLIIKLLYQRKYMH